jgi:hypothetical protein
MAKLKVILDEAPGDDVKEYYVEKDGKWYLDLEGVTEHPQVTGLKTSLEKERKAAKDEKKRADELDAKVKALPAEFTQDEWDRLKALDDIDPNDPEAAKKKKQAQDERLASQRAAYEQQITTLKTTKDNEIATLKNENESLKVARAKDKAALELDKAMDAANIDPKFRPTVRRYHLDNIQHEYDGENIRLFVKSDLGDTEVSSYIDTWSKGEEGKVYVTIPTGPDPRGNGNTLPNGSNPFLKANWNKTEQANLRNNPTVFNRLAQQAGFKDGAEALGATGARQ